MVEKSTAGANTPYFTLNNNWKPVSTDQVKTNGTENQYVSGLFMYAKNSANGPAVLRAKTADADVYTGELFGQVVFPAPWMLHGCQESQDDGLCLHFRR